MKNFFKSIIIYFYGCLFYIKIENSTEEEEEVQEIEQQAPAPQSSKKSRHWRKSERTAAGYLALYGYGDTGDLNESQIAYVLDRSVAALRRKISRLRDYEKNGNLSSINKDELFILNTELNLRDERMRRRAFSRSLTIAARYNKRDDNKEINEMINEMFSSSFRKI